MQLEAIAGNVIRTVCTIIAAGGCGKRVRVKGRKEESGLEDGEPVSHTIIQSVEIKDTWWRGNESAQY